MGGGNSFPTLQHGEQEAEFFFASRDSTSTK
jgi:hypothetical protein